MQNNSFASWIEHFVPKPRTSLVFKKFYDCEVNNHNLFRPVIVLCDARIVIRFAENGQRIHKRKERDEVWCSLANRKKTCGCDRRCTKIYKKANQNDVCALDIFFSLGLLPALYVNNRWALFVCCWSLLFVASTLYCIRWFYLFATRLWFLSKIKTSSKFAVKFAHTQQAHT